MKRSYWFKAIANILNDETVLLTFSELRAIQLLAGFRIDQIIAKKQTKEPRDE